MARRIQIRRDTAAAWSASNPVLAQGELGLDITNNKLKIGNGSTAWNSLAYWDDKVTDLSTYAGDIIPDADNTRDLGSPEKQWRHVYVSNGSIYLGDIKITNENGQMVVQQVTNPGQVNEEPVPDAPGVVTTDRLVHGTNTFILKDDGTIELNGELFTINTGNYSFDGNTLQADEALIRTNDGDLTLESDSDVFVDAAGGTKRWSFANDGNLTLPEGGDIRDSNGSSVLGGGGFTLPPNTTFDDFYEDGGATIYNNGGKIQLYSLVSEGNDGVNIRVKGDGGDSTWEFKSDGKLTLPNNTTVGNDLAGTYSSSFLCLPWGINDQTSGLFSSNGIAHPIFDPLIATVAVGWFVSGPGLTGVKEITDIVEMGDGDRAFIVDLTDGSLWADLSIEIPYRFYTPDYALVYNGTRLTVDSNEWNFTQAGDLTIPGNINEKVGNDLEIAVHNNRNNDGTPGSAVLSLTNNDAVDYSTYTTLDVGAYSIKLNTDYTGVFTGARHTWEFKRDGTLTLPGGSTLNDASGQPILTSANNFRITTDSITNFQGPYIWEFGQDGALTLPVSTSGNSKVYNTGEGGFEFVSNTSTWTFGTDGTTTFPNNELKTSVDNNLSIVTEYSPPVPPTTIEIVGADFAAVNLTYNKDGANSIWYPADYNPAEDPYIEYDNGYGIWVPGFEQPLYVNTGTLNVPLSQWNTNPPLGSVAPVGVYTYPNTYTKNWSFDTNGAINLPDPGTIRNSSGAANLVATNFAQLQWTTPQGASESDPNNTQEPLNWIYVEETGIWMSTNVNRPSGQSHSWFFDNNGNLTLPEGGDIKDSNGTSVLGGGASLTDDKDITVTVGNTNYFAIVNRTNADGQTGIDATAVAYDSFGNIITLHVSEVDLGGEIGNVDRLIVSKFSPYGATIWQKQIDQDVDVDTVHDVAIDSNDNIIVALSADNGSADDTIVLVKMGSDGTVLWQKDYHGILPVFVRDGDLNIQNNTPQLGTYDGNPAEYIQTTGDYSRFPTGSLLEVNTGSNNFTSLGPVLAITYDANTGLSTLYFTQGTLPGQLNDNPPQYYTVSGTIPNSHLEVGALVVNGDNIFVSGYYNDDNNAGDDSGFVMKASNTDGAFAWAYAIDVGTNFTRLFGMDQGADGHLVLVGTGESGVGNGAVVVKLNSVTGSVIWTSFFFDYENLAVGYNSGDVVVDSLNNVYVSVNTSQNIVHDNGSNTGVTIAYVTKINSNGARQWTRRIGPGPCASVATGIDCDSSGGVYLSALTVAQKNPNREINNYGSDDTKNVLAVAKYSPSGTVMWQRYIECDSYWFDASADETGGPPGMYNPTLNRGRNLSLGPDSKLAVQVSVKKKDANDSAWDYTYTESITFQIDQDGREMTVGNGSEKFTVKESRIPGKMITPEYTLVDLEETPLPITDVSSEIEDNPGTLTFSEGELAQQVLRSAPYNYVFGNDGTLTIPNDGDLKLVQTQIGWFSIYGPIKNDYNNVDIRASVVDPSDGSVYAVGESDDSGQGFLTRYSSQGEILWSIRFNDEVDGNNNRANAVKIHPTRGNVMVLLEYYGSYDVSMIVEIDPDTVKVVNSFGLRDQGDSGDATAYDFAFTTVGDAVIVGRKYDEYRQQSITPITGSTTDLLVFNASDISGAAVTNSFYVSGTGITGRWNVVQVNRHTGLTGMAQPGSTGVNFAFTFNKNSSDETSYAGGGWNITTPGTGYQVNDTITIPGTLLYGTSPANDLTVTVNSVDGNGGVTSISMSGTAQTAKINVWLNEVGVDFSTPGTWKLENNLGGEAFVWMGGFQKVLSAGNSNDTERYYSVALDADNNVYAAGEMIARNGAAGENLESYWCAVVTKINNDGTHAWTKALNDTLDNCYAKCVAVNGTTVVVSHQNSSGHTTITKLDTSGNVKWQRRTNSNDDSSVALDNNGNIYAVVEANFENKFSDVIKVIRFNSVGEIVWRKFIGHLTYDDSYIASMRFKNGRNLTLSANHLHISGYTYQQDDNYRSGVVIKIPATGDTDGYYGNWTLQQENYDVDKVNTTEVATFTPVVGQGNFEPWNPDFSTQWWDPSDNGYYHTLWDIFDRDGGAIEFADGTRQTRSAQMIPQKLNNTGYNHRLTLEDMGGHIYITQTYNGTTVHVPYHQDNPLPIGYTVVIVNNSGDVVNIDADGGLVNIIVPGVDSGSYWDLESPGMATLLKVDTNAWFLTGNVILD